MLTYMGHIVLLNYMSDISKHLFIIRKKYGFKGVELIGKIY